MKSKIVYLFIVLSIISCQQEPKKSNIKDLEKIADLESKIAQIEFEKAEKDKLVDEALRFFDEVQANLETIDVKNQEIKIKSNEENLTNDDKNWILDQIKQIQYLREYNTKKVNALSIKIKNSNAKIKELERMLERLAKDIQLKDEIIADLENSLNKLDQDYSKVFDQYQEQTQLVSDLKDELSTGYFTYGTEKELKENNVIATKNGILGIGKKVDLVDGFNEKYFDEVNTIYKKEFTVEGNSIRILTDHPSSSFELIPIGSNTRIKISNPTEFWKISKYLVVIVK